MHKFNRLSIFGLLLLACGASSVRAENDIAWQPNLETGIQLAQQTHRFVLIHFYSTNCPPCRALEKDVFTQPGVGASLESQFVPVRINVDQQPLMATKYGIDRWPTDVIITPDDHPIAKLGCPHTPTAYLAQLDRAVSTNPTALAYRPKTQATQPGSPAFNSPATVVTDTAGSEAVCFAAKPGQACNVMQVAYPQGDSAPVVTNVPGQSPYNPAPGVQPPVAAGQPYSPYAQNNAVASDLAPRPTGIVAAPVTPNPWQPNVNQPQMQPQQPVQQPMQNRPGFAPIAPVAPIAAVPVAQAPINPATAPNGGLGQPMNPQYVQQQPVAPMQPAPQQVAASIPPTKGLDGYCPVTLSEKHIWVLGNPQFGAIHLGKVYLFASEVEQKKFLESPNKYSPVLSGNDPVAALDHGQNVPGFRQFGFFLHGRIYLFSNDANQQQFKQNQARYEAEALQAESPRLPLR